MRQCVALFISLVVFNFVWADTTVYESYDQHGNPVFTDKKPKNSKHVKQIDIPETPTKVDPQHQRQLDEMHATDKKLDEELDKVNNQREELRTQIRQSARALAGAERELKRAQETLEQAKKEIPPDVYHNDQGVQVQTPEYQAYLDRLSLLEKAVMSAQGRVELAREKLINDREKLSRFRPSYNDAEKK